MVFNLESSLLEVKDAVSLASLRLIPWNSLTEGEEIQVRLSGNMDYNVFCSLLPLALLT